MAQVAGDDPVPVWRLFWRMGGWLALIFLVFFVFLTVISHTTLTLAERFDTEGRETTAEVLDKYERVSTDSDGDRTVTYYFALTFDTNAGERIDISRSVGSGPYRKTQVGDRIPIWYLQSDPDTTELSRGENQTTSRLTQGIALVFGLLALGALWVPGRKAVAAVRARRDGARETVEVLGTTRTSYRVNKRYRYRLTWTEPSGRVGESLAYKEHQLFPYPPGTEIKIYQGLKRAWWEGDVGQRPGD